MPGNIISVANRFTALSQRQCNKKLVAIVDRYRPASIARQLPDILSRSNKEPMSDITNIVLHELW